MLNYHLDEEITNTTDYHARTTGNRTFPWRTVIISPDEKRLLENELVYKLARPNAVQDTKWIRPGKVAWDWWNDKNIYGVNFKSGINTATNKYFIDFATDFGLDYIILDEVWSASSENIMEAKPELNMEDLMAYAKSKKVGIIL